MYILSTGCQWRALPKDLPPRSTVHDYLGLWTLGRHAGSHPSCALPQVPRESRARSQPHGLHHRQSSVKSAARRGWHRQPRLRCRQADQGQEAACSGRYARLAAHGRHTPPTFRIADGGLALPATLFGLFPFLGKLFADSAYQGPVFHRALAGNLPDLATEIAVKRSDRVTRRFVVGSPARWVSNAPSGSTAAKPTEPRTGRTSTATRSPSSRRVHSTHAPKTLNPT